MEKSSESYRYPDIKLVLIGTPNSGKKVFANKWSRNIATENDKSLISTDCYFKILKIDGYLLRIQIWELFGPNINHTSTTKIFAKDSLGAIFISDATNPEDLEIIQKWKHNFDECVSFINGTPLPSILIENKIELLPEEERMNDIRLKEFARENKFDGAFRVSSVNGVNVNESMDFLIRVILNKIKAIGWESFFAMNKNKVKNIKNNKPKQNDHSKCAK